MRVERCPTLAAGVYWTVSSEVVTAGSVYGMTKEQSGVINGVVQRGSFSTWYLLGSAVTPCNLAWNIPATGADSLTTYLESTTDHLVSITRTVIGKYGVVQYDILFVSNPGQTPSGSGDVALMVVTQGDASDGSNYAPIVTEVAQGSTGISGYFTVDLHDPFGPRNVSFDESAIRLQSKLQELTTVGKVFVERFFYPNVRSGGWGGVPVTPGAVGGFEWRVYFLANTGTYNGFSFPPGSGNIDPLTVEYAAGSKLFGSKVAAQSVTYTDGSVPIDGTFTLSYDGQETQPIRYDQLAVDTKYLLESLGNIGEVDTTTHFRMMEPIPGIMASVDRDSNTISVTYTTSSIDTPPDIRESLSAGDLIRIGGGDLSSANSLAAVDGSFLFGHVTVSSGSPIMDIVTPSPPVLLPGESLRIGADSYQVVKTGEEVQVLSITCPSATGDCGGFSLVFRHQSTTDNTACFYRKAGYEMTSASDVAAWFNNMPMVDYNDVVVTRSSSIDGKSYAFSIYFEGDSVLGDIAELAVEEDCDSDGTPDLVTGTVYTVFTAVEGGATASQSVRVNVESGYIDGDMFTLSYDGLTTPCIAFGEEPSAIATKLQSLSTISDKSLTTITMAVGSLRSVLYASSSIYGIVDVGTVLNIQTVGGPVQHVVVSVVKSGTLIYVTPSVTQAAYTTGLLVSIVNGNAAQVNRIGTGNSTSTIVSYTETADRIVDQNSAGFYKLKIEVGGVTGLTTCLKYHATAGDVEAAIGRISEFQFSAGDANTAGAPHITVTRRGDGSVHSGYGYTYFLRFGGPMMKFGRTTVLGNSQPTVEVIDEGHYGGCVDLNTTFASSLTATVAAGSAVIVPSVNPQGYIQAGDRIRFPTSTFPSKVFLVIATTASSITVDPSLNMAVTNQPLYRVSSPMAEYSVQALQEGEDSYSYDVFFTGPHVNSVDTLTVAMCANIKQFGGMRYGVDVKEATAGGNSDVQQLVISTRSLFKSTDLTGYFKLAILRQVEGSVDVLTPTLTKGFPWGVADSVIQTYIDDANANLLVTRSGEGSVEENNKFTYSFSRYPGSFDVGYSFPRVTVLHDKSVSVPLYTPFNLTEPQHPLDDIRVFGDFSGLTDQLYVVTISHAVANISISDKFTYNGVTRVIVPNVKYLLDNNVSVSFAHAHGHHVGDTFRFYGVRCDSSLPSHSVVRMSPAPPPYRQVTATQGYHNEGEATVVAYRAPAVFTVGDQSVEVWKLSTANPDHETPVQTTMEYRIVYNETFSGLTTTKTVCIPWNAMDFELEAALNAVATGLCSTGNCVTVTRGLDNINNQGGYIYSIYFTGTNFATNLDRNFITLDSTTCNAYTPTTVSLENVASGEIHRLFSSTTIPLGTAGDSKIAAAYRGLSLSRVPIYKVNGNYWAVTFNSNLGDLPVLTAAGTKYLTEGTELAVYDNVVQGENPSEVEIGGLLTGLPYKTRVRAYTRGTNHGYSAYTNGVSLSPSVSNLLNSAVTVGDSSVPSDIPPSVTDLAALSTLATAEVQVISVGASHLTEIQTITTTAPSYAEVQEYVISAPVGSTVAGHFALRFPEVQRVEVRAAGSTDISTGYFSLRYSYYTTSTDVIVSETTACLSLDALDSEVAVALKALAHIGDVEVIRSGYGGYTDYYGYIWDISFVGNLVSGNVLPLTVLYGTSDASCASTTFPDNVDLIVSTLNEATVVGTDTEIQTITVIGSDFFAQGSYSINFDGADTGCIAWNASAVDMKNALENLNSIDNVIVERFGSGDSTSQFGYQYSIYFTGNMFMRSTGALDKLTPNLGLAQCDDFAYFKNGVLTEFTLSEANVTQVSLVGKGDPTAGYSLPAASTSSASMWSAFKLLPKAVQVTDLRRSLTDSQGGYQYIAVFDLSMGNAPAVVCGMDAAMLASGASCSHNTVVDGNFIGGYFIVGTSRLFASDVSAIDMQSELQRLTGMGNVSVTRTGPDSVGGFVWSITWLTALGNQAPLTFSNSLTGSKVSIVGNVAREGNYLGGTYNLEYQGKVTSQIPYSADASQLTAALAPVVGAVSISRSATTTEGGSAYTVTFTGLVGTVDLLKPSFAGTLSGVGASVSVYRKTIGVRSSGSSVKLSFKVPLYCSLSQVPTGLCGSPISAYSLEVGDTRGSVQQTIPYIPSQSIQKIRVAAPSLYDAVYFHGTAATGFFQLGYNGDVTQPISTGASETDMRDAIESLPGINSVSVARTFSYEKLMGTVSAVTGSLTVTCADSCDFGNLLEGDLLMIEGTWYRRARGYGGSSTVIALAFAEDSSVVTFYAGVTNTNAYIYRWARGFEWTVTFLSVNTMSLVDGVSQQVVLPLASPRHGLVPSDASLSIRTEDCINCVYVENLNIGTAYQLKVSALNDRGPGPFAVTMGTPQQAPAAPASITVSSISGSQIKTLFSPPTGYSAGIYSYTVQWDTFSDFRRVLSTTTPGTCATLGYGQCSVTGASITVVPPFNFIIEQLTVNTKYFVRVVAINPISLISSKDEWKWSDVVFTTTANQAPSRPVAVTAIVASQTAVQITITPPTDNGGQPITHYKIEWDGSANFDDASSYGSIVVPLAQIPELEPDSGKLLYRVGSLTTGRSYWIRVTAVNIVGSSAAVYTETSVTPAGKPSVPTSVALVAATKQDTPITSAAVTWVEATGSIPDGGSPVTGYLVEWWSDDAVYDVQLITYFFNDISIVPAVGKFQISFSPTKGVSENTALLSFDASADNVRSELIDLGYTAGVLNGYNFDFLIGNIDVNRAFVQGKGYQWAVTFSSLLNQGNQPSLVASLIGSSTNEVVRVSKLVPGQRMFGSHETQIITIVSTGSQQQTDLRGYFTLSFNGSEYVSPFLASDATEEDVELAIAQLNTLRAVSVTRTDYISTSGSQFAGYQWTVTFAGDYGDQPVIQIQDDYLYSLQTAIDTDVEDGDNALDASNFRASFAVPGELPVGYNSRLVDRDARLFTLNMLVPGKNYFVQVSAVNNYGTGMARLSSPTVISPSKQAPQPPANVAIGVHPGSSSSLDVTYAAPSSDGGANITAYRIEIDTSVNFLTPIHVTQSCPNSSPRSVISIRTSASTEDPILSGDFQLRLSFSSYTFLTDLIPFDATATKADESGKSIVLPLTALLVANTNSFVVTVANYVHIGDRLQFDNQLTAGIIYTVTAVVGTTITVNTAVTVDPAKNLRTAVTRYLGGRGDTSNSRVTCSFDAVVCPLSRVGKSGSIQGKLEKIPEALIAGVTVDMDAPDSTNGFTWRVTFLDPSPTDILHNFALSVADNNLVTVSGAQANITITEILTGVNYGSCVGTFEVPPDKALNNGRNYFSRVFAINDIGYSLPQVSLSSQKPMVVPGAPTSVTISVLSGSSTTLVVRFNSPADDGGDDIVSYKVEYATLSDFSNAQFVVVNQLSGGAPFETRLLNLVTGTFYFVRVSAANSQGNGIPTISTPSSLNPYRAAAGPTNVKLYATSSSMLTVSFALPLDNGGDAIVRYLVEWDIAPGFNSLQPVPNKGSATVLAATDSSYTIQLLTPGLSYFVRVSAVNSAGPGLPTLATPVSAKPGLQVPGRPHTVVVAAGTNVGTIKVSWQRPRVPWHNIPCSGTALNPGRCPTPVGGVNAASDGGAEIAEYAIAYNDKADFTGMDTNEITTTNSNYVLTDLTPGRTYYIRVLARNSQGAGQFCGYTDTNCLVVFTLASATATADFA